MQINRFMYLALAAAGLFVPAAIPAHAQLGGAVAITYTCPTQTGSLPACTTAYVLPAHRLLVVQYVSGSATPIAPNAAGAFATGQASATIGTTIGAGETPATNIIGPNYALTNSQVWFFTNPVTFYSDTVPAVQNNGGPVVLQGYLLER